MQYKKEWQKIEDWISEKMKVGEAVADQMTFSETIPREEPELDYQVFLEETSRSMIRFKKPEHLIRMIVKTIDEHLKATHTAMLVHSKKKDCFLLVDSKGMSGSKIPVGFIRMTWDNPLIKFINDRLNFRFSDSGAIVYNALISAVKKGLSPQEDVLIKKQIPLVLKQMELLRANICLPIYYKKDLLG
ncbi:MAG TPA: hypothetical protein PKG81_05945, partial [Candidatus Omnitrophota bacterium]|nr:hypothetical protein [Candidatus Omnitrophota bacterium]